MLLLEAVQRCYSEFLEPAGVDRPAFDFQSGSLTDSATSITTQGLTSYVPQTVIEWDDSTMELAMLDTAETTATLSPVERGWRQTTAAAHSAGTRIWLNPDFYKIDVFNAIVSVIGQLYPLGLHVSATSSTTSVSSGAAFALESALIKDVYSVSCLVDSQYVRLKKGVDYDTLLDFSPIKMQFYSLPSSTVVIKVKKDFVLPTLLTDDLTTTCLVPSTLAPYIPMAAAGYLLQGRDIPAVLVEKIMREVEPDNVQPGTRLNLGQMLLKTFEQRYVGAERRRQREGSPHRFRYVG